MLWINFLHFYQPANIEFYHIEKALNKSYWRLLRLVEEHPDLHFTWNISACLLDRLAEGGEDSFIKRLKILVKKGQIELTASAAYHAFLPLLPRREIIKQIKEDEDILKKYFGKNFKAQGFFIPEMAYSPALAKIIKDLGYHWLILDEIAYRGTSKRRPEWGKFYLDKASNLPVIFRDRKVSRAYPPDQLVKKYNSALKTNKASSSKNLNYSKSLSSESLTSLKIYVTATDAELYGLRHEDPTGELERLVSLKGLKTLTISELKRLESKIKLAEVNLQASSWESSLQELKNNQPYRLWQDKNNKIQVDLWKLANLALSLEAKFKNDKNFYWYRWHLVRGLASCTFWWASARNFSKFFGPYAWSPDEIERGLEDLIRSIRSLANPRTKGAKLKAEKYYLQIKKHIWEEHWNKHWQKIVSTEFQV